MPDYSYQGKMSLWPYDPRFTPIAPPTAGIFDEPQMSICLNVEWAGHIDGVISRLLWTDAWEGTPEVKQWAVVQITALLASMIARDPCGGGMDCCDEILARLTAIEAAIALKLTPGQVQDTVSEMSDQYTEYIDGIDAIYDDDITNVHPDMAYGDDNDAIRDQALCFVCQRFVDIMCDWVVKNIELKNANLQTELNIAQLIASVSDLLGRIFAETAFGLMFENIDTVLSLTIAGATEWITSVTADQLAIYQDTDARKAVACGWYDALKGATPTASLFLSSLSGLSLSGHASAIQEKLLAALTPVDVIQQPNGEHIYFIWADLWQEAYDGAQAGIVPDCLCEEEPEPRVPVINSLWDPSHEAGILEGPDEDGFYTVTSENRGTDEGATLMDVDGRDFVLSEVTYSDNPSCQVWLLDEILVHIACTGSDMYVGETIDEWTVTWSGSSPHTMRFKMIAPEE